MHFPENFPAQFALHRLRLVRVELTSQLFDIVKIVPGKLRKFSNCRIAVLHDPVPPALGLVKNATQVTLVLFQRRDGRLQRTVI